jgi:hypothetical protein
MVHVMPNPSDQQAIDELLAMARVYKQRGHEDKSRQLLTLAELMEDRLAREQEQNSGNVKHSGELTLDA